MKRALLGAALALALLIPAAAQAAGPPLVKSTSFSHVTTDSATLEAQMDPNGKATRYHFEYGPADCASGSCTKVPAGPTDPQIPPTIKATATLVKNENTARDVQLSAGSFGSDDLISGPGIEPGTTVSGYDPLKRTLFLTKPPSESAQGVALTANGPQSVSFTLEGLSPATTYHFRIVASNSEAKDPVPGPDTTFRTYANAPTFSACPNDAYRTGPSARLPDCRAYEQVSTEKNAADIGGEANKVQAAIDGSGITYFSPAGLPGGVGAQDFQTYLARRGADSWSTSGVFPAAFYGPIARNAGWTPDLSLFFSNSTQTFSGPWAFNLRDSTTGAFSTIAPNGPAGEETFVAASADGNLVYFEAEAQLTPEATQETTNLYVFDRTTGETHLAGVLPDSACATPPCASAKGSEAGPYDWIATGATGNGGASGGYYVQDEHAVSTDGSRAYFTDRSDGRLYLREDAAGPDPKTIHVSASERSTPDPLGHRPAAFLGATPDGSKAFFTSAEKLTEDANTGPEPEGVPAIAKAKLSDGSEKDLEFLPAYAKGLFASGGFLYWANPTRHSIGRVDLNSPNPAAKVEEEFISGLDNPQAVTVSGEYIYWTDAEGERDDEGWIGRAKLVSSGVEGIFREFLETTFAHVEKNPSGELFLLTNFNPRGIAVDDIHIYWGDISGPDHDPATFAYPALLRANLDGSKVQEYGEFLNSPGEFGLRRYSPTDLAIDDGNVYVLHSQQGSGFIYRQSASNPRDSELVGSIPGSNKAADLATDGEHVFWTDAATNSIGRSNLDGSEQANEFISAARRPIGMAIDSSYIYWAANQEVSPNPGNDLYRFESSKPEGQRLTDLTPDPTDTNGAEVQGLLGTSADGSYVYFAANGDLDGAGEATSGNCQARVGKESSGLEAGGTCNLYLSHNGEITFIAPLHANTDATNWLPTADNGGEPPRSGFVSADGHSLLYRSGPSLYRFNTEAGIACVSCDPSGGSSEVATLRSIIRHGPIAAPGGKQAFSTRNLSSDGNRVFFETPDKLFGSDTNGEAGCSGAPPSCQDVYEWEAPVSGSCTESTTSYSPPNKGCLYLLSAGTGAEPSFFGDASASGDDVFIFTRDSLLPSDGDQVQDVYDARVGGGLAAQHRVAAVPCEAEACKSDPPSPPPPQPCGTVCFDGPTNQKPKKHKPHKKKAKHQKRHHHEKGGGR